MQDNPSAMAIDTDAVEWLESNLAAIHRMKPKLGPQPALTDFHKLAVTVIRRGMGSGIYNVRANWEKAEFNPRFLRITIRCDAWATFDFSELTRLVVAAHEACLRLQVEPVSRSYMAVFLSPRARDGGTSQRHPTIEQAVADFRGVTFRPAAEVLREFVSIVEHICYPNKKLRNEVLVERLNRVRAAISPSLEAGEQIVVPERERA